MEIFVETNNFNLPFIYKMHYHDKTWLKNFPFGLMQYHYSQGSSSIELIEGRYRQNKLKSNIINGTHVHTLPQYVHGVGIFNTKSYFLQVFDRV